MNSRELRVSDRERMRVAESMQSAMSEGFLTVDEFDDRTAKVLAARTRGDLAALTGDLPPRLRFDPDYDLRAARPEQESGEPVVLEHSLETIKHGAGWIPPPHVLLKAWGGTANLDFAAATLDLPAYRITLDLKGSTARLYLPDGCGLSVGPSISGNSGVKDKRRTMAHEHGRPTFQIDGQMTWSTLKLMGPRRGWWDT